MPELSGLRMAKERRQPTVDTDPRTERAREHGIKTSQSKSLNHCSIAFPQPPPGMGKRSRRA